MTVGPERVGLRYCPAAAVLLLSLGACIAVFHSFAPAVRVPIVFAFLLVGPGLPLVRLQQLGQGLRTLLLAVALSLALDALVVSVPLYAGVWAPRGALGVLASIAVTGAVLDAHMERIRMTRNNKMAMTNP